MPSSDVTTTRKPGSDFEWLIVYSIRIIMHNYEKF